MTDPDLPFGLSLIVVLTLFGIMMLSTTATHRQTLAYQRKLFLAAIALRFLTSLLLYQFGAVNVLKDEDASGWVVGVFLHEEWERKGIGIFDLPQVLAETLDGKHRGYYYLLGVLFHLTDVPARLPAAALNCFFGAFTVVMVYRIARSVFTEKISRRAGLWACLFPSMIIWSAQTLKEPVVIFLETIALYGCIRLKLAGFSVRHLTVCALAILLVIPFRFYAAYIAGAAVLLTLILPQFSRRKITIGSGLAIAGLVIPLIIASGVLVKHEAIMERFDLQGIQRYRRNLATGEGGGSGVNTGFDMNTPTGFGLATAVGAAHLLLAPFPWQLGGGSVRMLLTLPELLVWWWLFFLALIPGLRYAVRKCPSEIMPLLIFIGGLGFLYSVTFGNVGLAYRHRAQLLPWLLILASVGLEIRRLKQMEKKQNSLPLNRGEVVAQT